MNFLIFEKFDDEKFAGYTFVSESFYINNNISKVK